MRLFQHPFRTPKPKQQVFFVRGFPRSGTNWVSRLLNLHKDIDCQGEFHLQAFSRHLESFKQSRWQGSILLRKKRYDLLDQAHAEFVESLIKGYCKNALWVGDRTPIGLADVLIPHKKYILIVRDGRDVAVSWVYHVLRTGDKQTRLNYPDMEESLQKFQQDPLYFEKHPHELFACEALLRDRAKTWNQRILADHAIMNRVDTKELKISYLLLRYEDLHKDLDHWQAEMYHFLGAAPHRVKSRPEALDPGFSQHKPLSHNRKGMIGEWKSYFSSRQVAIFKEEAQQALDMLGYTWEA